MGIDVSETSITHTTALALRHGLDNLEVHQLPISEVHRLDTAFDHIVCTGVLHHLADPDAGLRALRDVLAPGGAAHVMVYAPYGRTGVYMIQEYCRRLAVETSPSDLADLVESLRELPRGHPPSHMLRNTPDFQNDDAVADALMHPRDRPYSVPDVFEFVRRADLEVGRWVRQAPYLPTCGLPATVAHGARISMLEIEEQYAAVELYRGTMTRHSLIAHRNDAVTSTSSLDFKADHWQHYVPHRPHTVISIEQRLPPGAAAALLNRAHEFPDLVMFVDETEKAMFEAVDGMRSIAEISGEDRAFFRRLFDHDLVVFDASETRQT